MTPTHLAVLLLDVARFTKNSGDLPTQEWIAARVDLTTAEVYGRRRSPERLAGAIAEALLDAGCDLDFGRFGVEPNDQGDYDASEVWDLLAAELTNQLDQYDIAGDERDQLKALVRAEFVTRF